ncbi:endonuclease III domain-containing protein [Candidatus Woesearchaeota archaeon]|nr:endonuclease III domain-containing protein [Candidatus Woesearchaeota archaeon]
MLEIIYNKLYSHFGPQHWWPVTEKGKLNPEYSGGPKNERQQLEVCFGTILAQNTSWKNAEKAIVELNKNNLINIKKILKIKNKKLAQIIKSSGYYNQKAKKLKNFCDFLSKNYDGKISLLLNNNAEELKKKLISINGIGQETADSIILYAAKKPVFVVDAYTKRILNRIGYKETEYNKLQTLFAKNLPNSERLFNEYHALLVELGKGICKKQPLCGKCPVSRCCGYYEAVSLKRD